MLSGEITAGIFFFLMLVVIGVAVFYTTQYFELRGVIERCNEDFGLGNWTFTETSKEYRCKYYNSTNFITSQIISTTSKECFENGVKVEC